MDSNILEKARKAGSVDELIALGRENGIDLNEKDAAAYYDALDKSGEIDDDDLDSVSGGACYTDDGYLKTTIGHSCKYYERQSGVNPSALDNTCYACKYWGDQFETYGSAAPIIIVGAPLTCWNPNNRKKK